MAVWKFCPHGFLSSIDGWSPKTQLINHRHQIDSLPTQEPSFIAPAHIVWLCRWVKCDDTIHIFLKFPLKASFQDFVNKTKSKTKSKKACTVSVVAPGHDDHSSDQSWNDVLLKFFTSFSSCPCFLLSSVYLFCGWCKQGELRLGIFKSTTPTISRLMILLSISCLHLAHSYYPHERQTILNDPHLVLASMLWSTAPPSYLGPSSLKACKVPLNKHILYWILQSFLPMSIKGCFNIRNVIFMNEVRTVSESIVF